MLRRNKTFLTYLQHPQLRNLEKLCCQNVNFNIHTYIHTYIHKRLRWSRGSVAGLWYPSSQVQTRIFQDEKILSTPSVRREVKPFVPCRRFTACKRSLNFTWKLGISRHFRPFLAHVVPPFTTRVSGGDTWRCK